MRAYTHTQRGSPLTVLSLNTIPSPSLDEKIDSSDVLVKITHAALNPGGSIMIHFCPFLFRKSPAIPELDFSGIVVGIGSQVPESRGLTFGTEVFGSILVPRHLKAGAGALAEFVVLPSDSVVKKPEGISLEEASGLGVAGAVALELVDKAVSEGGLKRGDKVLINGASGGAGTFVLQMVKDIVGKEGKVVAVCSGRNVEMVKGLGADEVVDYQQHSPVHQYLSHSVDKFDVVIDAYGVQELYHNSPGFLKEGRAFISIGVAFQDYTFYSLFSSIGSMLSNDFWPTWLGGTPRRYVRVTGLSSLKTLERLSKLVSEGKLKTFVDEVIPFEEASRGYEKLLSHRARGKIVVKVSQ